MQIRVIKVLRYDWKNGIFFTEEHKANENSTMYYRNMAYVNCRTYEDLKRQIANKYCDYDSVTLLDEQGSMVWNWRDVQNEEGCVNG